MPSKKCQEELNDLIGLESVKDEVASLTNLAQIRRIRAERGLVLPETSQHLVFMGNPGTGKTTVARIIGKIYHALGVLSKGHFIEVDRSGLVAGYVGQTALKTKEVIDSAIGGVLFIDEAYSLYVEQSDNDFGRESIETILKAMEDNRNDLVVIVAGYDALMPKFINSNPGLKSRFNKYINFPDYDGGELLTIFLSLLQKNQYSISQETKCVVADYMTDLYANRNNNFGNGRDVRNFFEKLISAQANRLAKGVAISEHELTEITLEDVNSVISH